MTLGPVGERSRPQSLGSSRHLKIRKHMACLITKRDLAVPSIQTWMVPSARSYLGSCTLVRWTRCKWMQDRCHTCHYRDYVPHDCEDRRILRDNVEAHGIAADMTSPGSRNFPSNGENCAFRVGCCCGRLAEGSRSDPGPKQIADVHCMMMDLAAIAPTKHNNCCGCTDLR